MSYVDLMTAGDADMKKVIIGKLLNGPKEEIERMKSLEASRDYEELYKVSHKMKSTLSFVGNATLFEINKKIEAVTKSMEDVASLSLLIEKLSETFDLALNELQDLYESL